MSAKPLVTVLITAYNNPGYLYPAIQSALSQDYNNLEVLVVDDGSDPKLESTVSRAGDRRVRYLYMHHQGLPFGLIRGMEAAAGDYVAILDHDDLLTANSITRRAAILDGDARVSFVYGDINYINSSGQIYSRQDFKTYSGYADFLHAILASPVGPVKHSGIMFRREHVLAVGNYDPSYKALYDNELLLRLAKNYPFAHVKEAVLNYRTHKSNATKVYRMRLEGIRSEFRFINIHVEKVVKRFSYRVRAVLINLGKVLFEMPSFRKSRWIFRLLGSRD